MAQEIIYDKCFAGNFKLLGFATGAYFCKCSTCGKQFVGDKLSFQCLECAIKLVEEKLTSDNTQSPKYFEECGEDVDNKSDCDKCFEMGRVECPRFIMQS